MKSLSLADENHRPRYVAHQVYYSLVGRDYEWELMPLGLDQGVGALVWSPLGWGRLTGKIRRGQPLPERSRLHDTAASGPPVDDEQLLRVVDVARRDRERDRQDGPADRDELAAARPTVVLGDHRRPQRIAAAREPRRGRLAARPRADRPARRGQLRARRRTPTSRTSARRGSPGSTRRSASVDGVAVQLDEPLIHLRVVPVVVDLGLGQLAADSAGHAGDQRPRRHRDTLRHERSRRDQ